MTKYPYANGSYYICLDCGHRWGHPKAGMGMWDGHCDICGQRAGMVNAQHDCAMDDSVVEWAKRIWDEECHH